MIICDKYVGLDLVQFYLLCESERSVLKMCGFCFKPQFSIHCLAAGRAVLCLLTILHTQAWRS